MEIKRQSLVKKKDFWLLVVAAILAVTLIILRWNKWSLQQVLEICGALLLYIRVLYGLWKSLTVRILIDHIDWDEVGKENENKFAYVIKAKTHCKGDHAHLASLTENDAPIALQHQFSDKETFIPNKLIEGEEGDFYLEIIGNPPILTIATVK